MKALFTTILYLDIPIAIISFIFAYIILTRGRNPIYFNFGMAVLSLALWMLTIILYFLLPKSFTVFLGNVSFLFGIWILHFFLIFTYYFPIPYSRNRLKIILFYIFTLGISISFFIPRLYIISSYLDFPYLYTDINPVGLSIFAFYFLILAIFSFVNLVYKYSRSDGIFRINLRKIIAGTAFAVVANVFFSILVYYFTDFDYSSVGAFFTFTVLLYIYSILFPRKLST